MGAKIRDKQKSDTTEFIRKISWIVERKGLLEEKNAGSESMTAMGAKEGIFAAA